MRETFFSCENEHTHTQNIHQLGNMKFLSQRRSFISKAGTALLILLVPRQS